MGDQHAKTRLQRTVTLIGMMGAGKTAVGRVLAAQLDADICDSDTQIVENARLTIPEIFNRFGEPFFRDQETHVIADLLGGAPCILSVGGGAWLTPQNQAMMRAKSMVIWLNVDLNTLWQRVCDKDTRPLLQTENPKQTLADLYATRTPIYALAPHRLDVAADWSVDDTAAHVLALMTRAGAVRDDDGS